MKKVILVSGKLRSGKNQFADYLKETLTADGISVRQDLFAKALKDNSKQDYKRLIEYLNTISKKHNIPELFTIDENFYENKNEITRILLQTYGTEIFRNRVDDNYWVKQFINRVKESNEEITIATDVRFPNEIELLLNETEFECISIRIERGVVRDSDLINHPSETSLDDYDQFTFIVDNNGTLEELKHASETIKAEMQQDEIKLKENHGLIV